MRPGADPNNPQPGDYIQTTSLSPDQQSLYDSQNAISQDLLKTGMAKTGQVDQAMANPLDTSGLGQWNQSIAPADDASRQRVEQAMMSRMNPELNTQEASTRNRLIQAGIQPGSQAWDAEMGRVDRSRNDAMMQAVLAGGNEESRQFGLNERAANFGNQARAGQLGEMDFLRNLPLQELNQLRSGAQPQIPTFSGTPGANVNPADILGAGMAQGQNDMSRFQTQQAGQNSAYGTVATLAMAAAMYF